MAKAITQKAFEKKYGGTEWETLRYEVQQDGTTAYQLFNQAVGKIVEVHVKVSVMTGDPAVDAALLAGR